MTITELAIKKPILVIIIFSFLGVLGFYGFSQLKYDLMPKMSAPLITISTIYPGGSPNEVETSVTKVIEDAVTGLDKVYSVRSSSYEGRSFIAVEFDQDVNINLALQDAQRKINAVSNLLPQTARQPVISKIAFDEIPVLKMSVRGNLPGKEMFQFVKDRVQPRLTKIGGVGIVNLLGGEEREIKVSIDYQKLRGYGLSLFQVAQVIKASNIDFPTGNIKDSGFQYVVRVAGNFKSVDEINELVISRSKLGGEIKLKDIAEVRDGIKETTNINRLNGQSSIGIVIQKQNDANTVEVCNKVLKELRLMEKDFSPNEVKFEVAQNASTFIITSANAVKEDLALAIILVALVMMIFLHSIRNSLIVMVAIPSSLVSTFFIMYIAGFSLNMMTLLAMSLVIGILVDDSIVVLENIYRHLEKGERKRVAALNGRNEIGFAALSITLVDVVVFLPLALIVGTIGSFLREYSLVVVFSTLMSLFVSFTITPMLASRFTKLENLSKKSIMGAFGKWFEKFFNKLTDYYERTLKWSLNNGGKVVLLSFALFILSFLLPGMGFIGMEFIPQVDRGELIVTIEAEPGSSIETTNSITHRVEHIIAAFPEVDKILANVGASSEGFIGMFSNNASELYVTLIDKNLRSRATDVIGQAIKREIHKIPGIKVRVNPVSLMGTSNRPPIQFLVSGPSHDDVIKGAKQLMDVIRSVEGTSDVRLSFDEGKPELRVEIDRKQMAQFGLTINDIGQNLKIALTGDDLAKFRDGLNEFDIRIQLDQFDRSNTDLVGNFSFMNLKGQHIELKQFAKIFQSTGPTKLERENRIASVNVFSQAFGRTSGSIAQDIMAKLEKVSFPRGVTYTLAGEQKTMADSFTSLLVALLAGILFVYMIMVALYDSFLYPFVVLFSIPLAMVGAFLGLALTMKSISIYSILGIIMLVGLVAKNAILLVDRTNQMKFEKNLPTFDALINAGRTRLRPILMTTFSMIFGMMPIALSRAAGSEAKSGLAVVLIGGLTSSMLLTLVLVPVVYQAFDKWKIKLQSFIYRKFKIVRDDEF